MKVELLYFDGCPHWELADARLRTVAEQHGLTVEHRLITTPEGADAAGFRGSPTILIDGVDRFARGDEPYGLACRIYATADGPAGSPTVDQIEAALAHA